MEREFNLFETAQGQIIGAIAAIYLLTKVGFSLRAILNEILFYRSNGWNFWVSSPHPTWQQDFFLDRFKQLPPGQAKLLGQFTILCAQLAIAVAILWAVF